MQISERRPAKTTNELSVISPILEWVDLELHEDEMNNAHMTYHESDYDLLLELRGLFTAFREGSSANKMIAGFYQLLPKLHINSYLLCYRIRQWIALNFTLRLSDPLQRMETRTYQMEQSITFIHDCRVAFMKQADDYISTSDLRIEIIATSSTKA